MVKIVEQKPTFQVGTIIYKGIKYSEIPIGIAECPATSEPIIAIEDGLYADGRCGWIVDGKHILKIGEKYYLSVFGDIISAQKADEHLKFREGLKLWATATPEFKEALGWKVGPVCGGLRDGEYGHALAWYDVSILGKKVRRYWTECNGPGSSCPYDHPKGFKPI